MLLFPPRSKGSDEEGRAEAERGCTDNWVRVWWYLVEWGEDVQMMGACRLCCSGRGLRGVLHLSFLTRMNFFVPATSRKQTNFSPRWQMKKKPPLGHDIGFTWSSRLHSAPQRWPGLQTPQLPHPIHIHGMSRIKCGPLTPPPPISPQPHNRITGENPRRSKQREVTGAVRRNKYTSRQVNQRISGVKMDAAWIFLCNLAPINSHWDGYQPDLSSSSQFWFSVGGKTRSPPDTRTTRYHAGTQKSKAKQTMRAHQDWFPNSSNV